MHKGASRNQQRIGLKVTAGTARAKEANALAAPVKQLRFAEAQRLARIRRVFEIEQQLKGASGSDAVRLRSELEGMRTGRLEPPIYLAQDPRPKPDRQRPVTVAERNGPERVRGTGSNSDPKRVAKGLEVDLADLARAKVTLTGVALVKTLLSNFEPSLIAEAIGAKVETIAKIAGHPLLQITPALPTEDGLVLVTILEERFKDLVASDPKDDEEPAPGPSPAP